MQTNRRNFLKLGLAGTSAVLVHQLTNVEKVLASPSQPDPEVKKKAALFDVTKCVGCRACQSACKHHNNLPADSTGFNDIYDNPFRLSSKTLTLIKYKQTDKAINNGFILCKFQCMHCEKPACVEACLVGAFTKTPEGPVIYDDGKCIGCRYCMVACPFGVPTFEWNDPLPWICKCNFCYDRQQQGLEPACAEACPTGAIKFGNREDLIAEARERIKSEPRKYVNHIYGEKEIGGTCWLYLSPVPFEELGFPSLDDTPVTVNVQRTVSAIPPTLLAVGATMAGIYVFKKRRNTNSHNERKDKDAGEIVSTSKKPD